MVVESFFVYSLPADNRLSLGKCAKKQIKNANSNASKDAVKNLTDYIEKANCWNLFSSIVVAILGYVSVCIKCDWFLCIMFGLICYRILSRTLEINISFVKDICENSAEKSSSLNSNDRVRPAIKSLIEEAVLFAAMYCFLLKPEVCFIQSLTGGLHSFILDTFSSPIVRLTLSFFYPQL